MVVSYKKTKRRPNRAFVWNDNWNQGCYVFWPVTSEQLAREYRRVNKNCPEELELTITKRGGKFICANDISCIAFADSRPQAGMIAHEAYHYVTATLQELGMACDPDNDEAHAYYIQWLVNHVYNLTRGIKCES